MDGYIERHLIAGTAQDRKIIAQDDLPTAGRNIVVLGEAGMGKTELLRSLQTDTAKYLSARSLTIASDPKSFIGNQTLILIDAVDEVAGQEQGDVIMKIADALRRAGCPPFILSCRAEDWRAATAASAFEDFIGEQPLEMTLRPFARDEIIAYLTRELGEPRATEVFGDYSKRGFTDWLGNPQTLEMLARVARQGYEPRGTAELFDDYVGLAWAEANKKRAEAREPGDREAALDTLGAAFAAVILGDHDGIAVRGSGYDDRYAGVGELASLPGFGDWDGVQGNRLLRRADGADENSAFTYIHRRVGEYLAARWMARQANMERLRHRLLANLSVDNIVPASLRGLFAWLAAHDGFTKSVIETDPMAVIEYGDADVLGEPDGARLLEALEQLALENPRFMGGGDFRARSLVRGTLRGQSLGLIESDSTPDRLRMLLAQQFAEQTLGAQDTVRFRVLALNADLFYALRHDAAQALVGNLASPEWATLVRELVDREGSADARLAAEIIHDVGIDHFTDDLIADTVLLAGGFRADGTVLDDTTVGALWRYRRDMPAERLHGILDAIARRAIARLPEHRSLESSEIINLGDALLAQRLKQVSDEAPVEPADLLRWLRAFGGRDSYLDEAEIKIEKFLAGNTAMRRAIQRLVATETIDDEKGMFETDWKLNEIHSALGLTESDAVNFLERQSKDFPHWRDAVRLFPHSEDKGVCIREAVRRFFGDEEAYVEFIDQLLNPPPPPWQTKRAERQSKYQAERDQRWIEFRSNLSDEIDALTLGRFGPLMAATNAYCGRFSDVSQIKTIDERLDTVLGESLTSALKQGLEAWLAKLPQHPAAYLMARDYGADRGWSTAYILIAALNERLRQSGTLDPVDPDQLIAARLHFAHMPVNSGVNGDEWKSLSDEIERRVLADAEFFERFARFACEPGLSRGKEIVMGLHYVVQQAGGLHAKLVVALAKEWLTKHWRMHERAETDLIDVLLDAREYKTLRMLVPRRLRMRTLTEARRRNWQAVALIADFEGRAKGTANILDQGLFWAIRARIGGRRFHDDPTPRFPVVLAAWMVEYGRRLFPVVDRPNGVTSGDTNPWDASDTIFRLISRIGSETSPNSGSLLNQLAMVQDGYHEHICAVAAEYRRAQAEADSTLISIANLRSILTGGPPVNHADLQIETLRLLDEVQARIASNDTDSWTNFYHDRKRPKKEEDCSNALIDILRQLGSDISFTPEKHLGNDREGDIACQTGQLHLPIEVKGQWHQELWRAADNQLAAQQAVDHAAGGYGIFLALWFGDRSDSKRLRGPPKGSGLKRPQSAEELATGLRTVCAATRSGRIAICVIDLSR